jgi:hypothetical protein
VKASIRPQRANLQTLCDKSPFFSNVTWFQADNEPSLDTLLYKSYAGQNYIGGFTIHDIDSDKADISINFNETLTRALDVPVWMDLIASAFLKSLGTNITATLGIVFTFIVM